MKNAGDGKVCARQVGGKQISQMRGPKGKCELSLVGIITGNFMDACSVKYIYIYIEKNIIVVLGVVYAKCRRL